MVHLTASLAAAAVVLCQGAHGSPRPLVNPRAGNVENHNGLGFDESLIGSFPADAIVPEIRYLSAEDIRNLTNPNARTATSSQPFVPDSMPKPSVDKRFIVGDDNRFYNEFTNYPFASVGRLGWSNGIVCSASLIGPRHVLTARHCLPKEPGISGVFAPGYDNGERFGRAEVVLATAPAEVDGPCWTKGDWAILILNDRPGDRLGWFGVKYPEKSKFGQPILNNQGYPGDRDGTNRPYASYGSRALDFSLDCDSTGPVYTDTDVQPGQSGGPLWENDGGGSYIWGSSSITVQSSQITYAGWASGSDLLNTVFSATKDYP